MSARSFDLSKLLHDVLHDMTATCTCLLHVHDCVALSSTRSPICTPYMYVTHMRPYPCGHGPLVMQSCSPGGGCVRLYRTLGYCRPTSCQTANPCALRSKAKSHATQEPQDLREQGEESGRLPGRASGIAQPQTQRDRPRVCRAPRVNPHRYVAHISPCRKSGALEQLFCGRASVAATGRNWCCTGLRTRTV